MAASLATGTITASAQSGTVIQVPHDATLKRAKLSPYNYSGRIFSLGNSIGFGTGTLIRRHTVLTAGHVLYDPTVGFTDSATFTRALYGNYQLQASQIIRVAALAGYQSAVDTAESNTTAAAFAQDLGYALLGTAPVDEDWATFTSNPTLLTMTSSQFFVLGYPGVSFDGRTLAYVVPQVPFVPTGTSATTGSYSNTDYTAQPGMSGGPVYVVLDNDPNQRYVAAETVGGIDDGTGTFNVAFVRAIDATASRFLTGAEYTNNLIKQVKVVGPSTVSRGSTVTYKLKPKFAITKADGTVATTARYGELQLTTNSITVGNQAGVTITKTSNTTFDVTFSNSSTLRPGSTITLQANYADATAAPGKKSAKVVRIQ